MSAPKPLHIATLGATKIRFVRPIQGSQPWVVLADVWAAANVSRDFQVGVEQALRDGPYPAGPEEISPLDHPMVLVAADMASAWVGRHAPEKFVDYLVASATALRIMSTDAAPNDDGGAK